MQGFNSRCLIGLVLLLLACATHADSVYKWVGPEGVTHYANSHPTHDSIQVLETDRGVLQDAMTGYLSPEAVARTCPTQLCIKVAEVDPYCRTLECRVANSIDDDCFSPHCQRKRRNIEDWVAEQQKAASE
jgi:hypothetical protein